jgi:hypothetical protein
MPVHSLGIAAGRDHFTVALSGKELRERLKTFIQIDREKARDDFKLGPDSRDWQVKLAQEDLKKRDWVRCIAEILYRPFDSRETCYTGQSRGFHCMPRQDVMRHFFGAEPNFGLCTTRSVEISAGWHHVFATRQPIQLHSVSLKEVNYVFPLYLYPNGKMPEADLFPHANGRRPNLSAKFIEDFCQKLRVNFVPVGFGHPAKRIVGPDCMFNYAYAVFHSPDYRERYAQFLRADFPRLPITCDFELFRALAGFGGELVDLHARGKGEPQEIGFPVKGDNVIDEARYQPTQGREPGRVWINDEQYFEPVAETAWTFPIGGYLPAQRWLKDRIGRTLGYDEQQEYQRIIWALMETRRLMAEIDASIKQHGGWPMN